MKYNSIRPGQTLFDTNGNRVQAHGGSIFYENGIYYFYGENKEYTNGKNGIWTWGVRAYASTDLYNWEDKGLIIKPVTDDEKSPLNPTEALLDRPHIIYNQKTGKYVCWMKIMQRSGGSVMNVMTADKFLGPYVTVKDDLKPLGMNAGDFDLAVAPDGKGYIYFERAHSETICADLTEDYCNVTGYYSSHFPHPYPPYVREATAHFVRNYRHYLITSGTTGYHANPSETAVADSWHGPYTVLGNPHPSDMSRTSFGSQISSVFKVPGKKDLYIALGDRWLPDEALPYELTEKVYVYASTGRRDEIQNLAEEYHLTETQVKQLWRTREDTSIADYVWLPLRFVEPCEKYPDGMVLIDWKDEWRIEDYQ